MKRLRSWLSLSLPDVVVAVVVVVVHHMVTLKKQHALAQAACQSLVCTCSLAAHLRM
jgi:hypothetical protein